MRLKVLFLFLGSLLSFSALSQARPLIQGKIDGASLVTLKGSASPLARMGVDEGAVPDSFAAERLILLLNRPPEREAALRQFLQDVQTRGSANYHKWLTPEQFGERFGPAAADIETAAAWLSSQGFQVVRTSKGGQFIEFSGMVGQLRETFHTEIHQYRLNGASKYGNSGDVEIPAALAPLVRGLAPIGGLRAQPYIKIAGTAAFSRSTGKATPQWTIPNPFGTANSSAYLVAPEDFATEYDLAPLYQAGVNGAGQTIGIIDESNIDLSLVQDYQNLFGTGAAAPQLVIDGDDPGDLSASDVETYLDVELSGAVAPKATVNLYLSSDGGLTDPIELAALRAVEDNQASVLSLSFGECEYFLGGGGNQFWADLWEQAAAQGQTVFVAAGDSGPGCEPGFTYPTVSGIASTPWDVAMGGTDFYYSDYASGANSATTLWNATNDAHLGSLKARLPEQAWDDPFGLNAIPNSIQRNEFGAGGGGASNCTTQNASENCTGGYAKPAWQNGPGVPADGARDLPDLSLYASNGANLSAYAICSYEGECAPGSGDTVGVELVGGTSAAAPAMAGIMALIDQKYGRQGQANQVFYALAQQKPVAFHDISLGGNFESCGPAASDCVLQPNGYDATTQYPAGPGYDQATGLGSVDAAALVNNWHAIAFKPTVTTLQLSSSSVTHGTPVTVTTSVASSSGSGTPTGDVAVLTDAPLPSSAAQLFITLSHGSGTSSGINYLPGGSYQVTGRYGGDGTFAGSKSSPVPLTVKPENSNINFLANANGKTIASGAAVAYNSPLTFSIQPSGVSAGAGKTDGNATGSAQFTVDSTTSTVALNGLGLAAWSPPALAIGNHTARAAYLGDASFNPSSSTPITFSVTKGLPFLNMNLIAAEALNAPEYDVAPGSSLTIGVTVAPGSGTSSPPGTSGPTGTVEVCLGTSPELDAVCQTPVYSQTATLAPPKGAYGLYSTAVVTFTNLASGYYVPTFNYNGDANWQAAGLQVFTTIVVAPIASIAASTTTLSISPASISGTEAAQFVTTVTGPSASGAAPTGIVYYYNNGNFLTYDVLTPANTGATSSTTFSLNAESFWNSGSNQITAIYSGDSNYGPSTSNLADLTAIQTQVGNYSLAPQSAQLTVQPGSSATVGINLASISGFSGAVALTCAPSSSQFSCSVNPGTVTVSGQTTATLSVNASIPTTAENLPAQRGSNSGAPAMAGMLAAGFVFLVGRGRRRLRPAGRILFTLCLAATLAVIGCGGGNPSTTPTAPPPPGSTPAGSYSVLVTGTGNGIVHNAKIMVIVP